MLGLDPIKGPEIMNLAGLSVDDLQVPQRLNKITDVVNYLQDKQDYRYWISKLTRGETDKLHKLHSWVELRKKREQVDSRVKQLNDSWVDKGMGEKDYETIASVKIAKQELRNIDQELKSYEG